MTTWKRLLSFGATTLLLLGCATPEAIVTGDMDRLGPGDSSYNLVVQELWGDKRYTVAAAKSERSAVATDWVDFLAEAKVVSIKRDELAINMVFDADLRSCKQVQNATSETIDPFAPSSPFISSARKHQVSIFLVSAKNFQWRFPLTADKSYFAVPVDGCGSQLTQQVFDSVATVYHELYHVYRHDADHELTKQLEETNAALVENCALLTSVTNPSIGGVDQFDSPRQAAIADYPRLEKTSPGVQASMLSEYESLFLIYYEYKRAGNYKKACENLLKPLAETLS